MGMNFDIGLFDLASFFWVVLAAMVGIATAVLWVARVRSWI
jgi:Mg2+ and Co2+ transporter CorA